MSRHTCGTLKLIVSRWQNWCSQHQYIPKCWKSIKLHGYLLRRMRILQCCVPVLDYTYISHWFLQVKSHQKNTFTLNIPISKFALVMHWAGQATSASCFVQRCSIYTWCKQLLPQSLLCLQHTDTYTIWARFRGFSGWSGNIGCKGSRLEAQLKDLLSALVSFLAGDFWEEQGR